MEINLLTFGVIRMYVVAFFALFRFYYCCLDDWRLRYWNRRKVYKI